LQEKEYLRFEDQPLLEFTYMTNGWHRWFLPPNAGEAEHDRKRAISSGGVR